MNTLKNISTKEIIAATDKVKGGGRTPTKTGTVGTSTISGIRK